MDKEVLTILDTMLNEMISINRRLDQLKGHTTEIVLIELQKRLVKIINEVAN